MIKKLILFFSIFILVSANLNAQKCNYEKNEVDAVTDLQVRLTQPMMLVRVGGQPLYVKGQSIGTNMYLKLRVYNYTDFNVQEDREITFTLSNSQEITLFPRTMPIDSSKIDSYMNVSTLMVYKLSSDQYLQLKDNAIVKFKYYLDSGFVEEKIKEKNQGSIMAVLNCLE